MLTCVIRPRGQNAGMLCTEQMSRGGTSHLKARHCDQTPLGCRRQRQPAPLGRPLPAARQSQMRQTRAASAEWGKPASQVESCKPQQAPSWTIASHSTRQPPAGTNCAWRLLAGSAHLGVFKHKLLRNVQPLPDAAKGGAAALLCALRPRDVAHLWVRRVRPEEHTSQRQSRP